MKRVALLLCLSSFAFAQGIELPHTLSNGSVADADEVMVHTAGSPPQSPQTLYET